MTLKKNWYTKIFHKKWHIFEKLSFFYGLIYYVKNFWQKKNAAKKCDPIVCNFKSMSFFIDPIGAILY